MKEYELISVIVTTYNRPDALSMVLQTLSEQTDPYFEVIIADDGSTPETRELVEQWQAKKEINIEFVWQEDVGFRAASIRNKAVAAAKGRYLVFLDGDCLVQPDFLKRHRQLMSVAHLVVGNRVLLSKRFTNLVLQKNMSVHHWKQAHLFLSFCLRRLNRFLPLLTIGNAKSKWRRTKKKNWKGAKTCNLGCWREDFLIVNGFDEQYKGWGLEDTDFVVRLLNSGVNRCDGRFFVPVLHLWHEENDRSALPTNHALLSQRIQKGTLRIEQGVDQYLDADIFHA